MGLVVLCCLFSVVKLRLVHGLTLVKVDVKDLTYGHRDQGSIPRGRNVTDTVNYRDQGD